MIFFTKTWVRDLYWLKWAFRSVYKYCDEDVTWHVVTENHTCQKVQELVDECVRKSGTSNYQRKIIVHGLQAWPEAVHIKDSYMAQQWIKMTAHRVAGDVLMWNWDSDVFAQKHFKESDFMSNGKPVYWYSTFDHFKSSPDYGTLRKRADLVANLLSQPVDCEWMRCMPIPLIGSILREGSKNPAWNLSYRECAAGNRALSEFNVIGQFANIHFKDAFEWRIPETQGPSWSGPMGSSSIVFQNWSWGGATPEIRHWIQQEFGE